MSLIKSQIKLKLNKNNKHDGMMGRAIGAVRDPYNDVYLLFKSLESFWSTNVHESVSLFNHCSIFKARLRIDPVSIVFPAEMCLILIHIATTVTLNSSQCLALISMVSA